MNNEQKGSIDVGKLIGVGIAAMVATLVVGFTWGGWVTGGSAQAMSKKSTDQAVAERLGNICAAQAQQADDIQTQLEELKKVAAYNRVTAVMKKPWAVMPGEDKADRAVASVCVNALLKT